VFAWRSSSAMWWKARAAVRCGIIVASLAGEW
jgi:hypothetical protein